jgi:hypothetical protein
MDVVESSCIVVLVLRRRKGGREKGKGERGRGRRSKEGVQNLIAAFSSWIRRQGSTEILNPWPQVKTATKCQTNMLRMKATSVVRESL